MFKQFLFGTTWLLAGLLIGIAGSNFAQQKGLELQAERGTCHHHQAVDGTFYQSKYQTNNQLNPNCSGIALAGLFDDERGWRVSYQDFGTIRARDNRFTRLDEEAHLPVLPACNHTTLSGCMASMYGQGSMKGVSFSLTRRWPVKGVDLLGEAGLLFFNSEFHAWAQNDHDKQVVYAAKEECKWISCPPDLVLGGGLRWKSFYVMARKNFSVGHRAQSLTDFNVTEVKIGVAIPL